MLKFWFGVSKSVLEVQPGKQGIDSICGHINQTILSPDVSEIY